jgi:hypothetical protein
VSADPVTFEVRFSQRFRDYLAWLDERAQKKPHGAHASLFRGLRRGVENLANPDVALSPSTGLRDDLRGLRRTKYGRGRLFFIASSAKALTIVLHFAETRRAGDPKRDAYAEMARLVRSDEFDLLFEELGIAKPKG